MKKLITFSMLFLAVVLVFSACKNKNNIPDNRTLKFQSAASDFLGDPTRSNVDFYDLNLYDNNLTNNPNGDGTFTYLQFNTSTTNENEIVTGSYLSNKTNQIQEFTYEIGIWKTDNQGSYVSGSYIGIYKNGQLVQYAITDGKITVSRNNNYYTVNGTVTADGNQYSLSYQGQIEFTDMVVQAGKFIEKIPETAAEIAVSFLDPDKKLGLKVPLLKNVLKESRGIKCGDLYPAIEDLDRIHA